MKNNKKILIGVAQDGKGGIDKYMLSFVKIANKNGYTCDLLTTKYSKKFKDVLAKHNANLIKIANLHDKKNIYKKIESLQNKNNYCAAYWNISTALMHPYIKATEQTNIKLNVVQSHAAKTDVKNPIMNFLQKTMHYWYRNKINNLNIEKAAVSELSANWMYGNLKNFIYVPEPINAKAFAYNESERLKIREQYKLNDSFVIGCATNFLPVKNPLFMVDVMYFLQKRVTNAKILICGEGPLMQPFKDKAKNKLLKDSYILPGYRSDTNKIYQAMDAFIFPSKFEGLGMALVEAQASGLPCVYNKNLPKEAEVIKNLTYKMENYNAEDWADALYNISKNKGTRSKKFAEQVESAGFKENSHQIIIDLINKLSK